MSLKKIKCPTCEKLIEWSPKNPCRPFCSERCKLIDLGAWADESYRVPDTEPQDFTESTITQDRKPHSH